jgi:hypothetical protein
MSAINVCEEIKFGVTASILQWTDFGKVDKI